jgi:hypothetical protein
VTSRVASSALVALLALGGCRTTRGAWAHRTYVGTSATDEITLRLGDDDHVEIMYSGTVMCGQEFGKRMTGHLVGIYDACARVFTLRTSIWNFDHAWRVRGNVTHARVTLENADAPWESSTPTTILLPSAR